MQSPETAYPNLGLILYISQIRNLSMISRHTQQLMMAFPIVGNNWILATENLHVNITARSQSRCLLWSGNGDSIVYVNVIASSFWDGWENGKVTVWMSQYSCIQLHQRNFFFKLWLPIGATLSMWTSSAVGPEDDICIAMFYYSHFLFFLSFFSIL